jgi:hypothetical protein
VAIAKVSGYKLQDRTHIRHPCPIRPVLVLGVFIIIPQVSVDVQVENTVVKSRYWDITTRHIRAFLLAGVELSSRERRKLIYSTHETCPRW